MGWFADAMRLLDVINVVTSIEIPLPDMDSGDGSAFDDDASADSDGGLQAA